MEMKTLLEIRKKVNHDKYLINWYNEARVSQWGQIIPKSWRKKVRTFLFSKQTYGYIVDKTIREWEEDLFQVIEIETINRCNGECPFCPVNRKDDKRPFALMEEETFKKIIDELSEMDYKGILALHSNNEPLLDKRLCEFVRYSREKLPMVHIYFFTNGTLLTVELFQKLEPYISRIDIDNYNDDLTMNPPVQKIYEYCCQNNILSEKVNIILRKANEVLSSRGGMAPNKRQADVVKEKCLLPFVQMVIRSEGKVSLCCNDAVGKFTLGDVKKQTLREIWFGRRYQEIRNSMINKGRIGISLCQKCDDKHSIYF